jgi:uncharacterized protein YraI
MNNLVWAAATAMVLAMLAGNAEAQFPEPPQPQADPAPGPALGTTTPVHVVSLRAAPNSNAPVIGTLHPGEQLQILATGNYGWTEVQSPAGTGWAYGSYLASGAGTTTGISGNVVPTSAGTVPASGDSPSPTSASGPPPRGIISP